VSGSHAYGFFNKLNKLNIPIRMDLGQDDVSPYPELIEVLKKEAHRLEYTSYKGIQELREKRKPNCHFVRGAEYSYLIIVDLGVHNYFRVSNNAR